MKRSMKIVLSVLILVSFIATSLGFASISVKSIKLNATSVKISAGKTYWLKVTYTPANATNKKVTFSSANKSIATVSSTGYIKGIKAGKTVITVTSASNKKAVARCNVTISQGKIVQLTAFTDQKLISGLQQLNQMDTKIGRLIAAETGVAFNQTFISGDKEQIFNLRLASNEWTDVISIGINYEWLSKLLKAGVIVPLEDKFKQPDKYPNLAKIPAKVLENYTYTDGHIYMYPSDWYEDEKSIYGYWCFSGWYVYPEYLDAVGMRVEDLGSLDGIEKFLLAVKQKGLKAGELSVLPMSGGENATFVNTILNTFGVSTANYGFDKYDGKLLHFRDHPKTKEALLWLNKLYRKGLIDKEIATHKNDQYTEKIMNKRIALVADRARSFWSAVTTGKTTATDLQYIKYPTVPGVKKLGINFTYNPYGSRGIFVTKNCKDKEAVAKLAEWGSVTGVHRQWDAWMGPRGTVWDWDEKLGKPYYKIIDGEIIKIMASNEYSAIEKTGIQKTLSATPSAEDYNYFNINNQEKLFWIFGMHKFNVKQGFHTIARPMDNIKMPPDGDWNKYVGILQKLDVEYYIKLIMADSEKTFEEDWNQYTKQLEVQGHWSAAKDDWMNTYKSQVK